jgi:alpha-amylase/alpha-mannosidase (GH57 family)
MIRRAKGKGGTGSTVLHGHFYQPPREDPWTGRVPEQPTAAPFHDWNERIEAECYRPITRSRVLADERVREERVNCLEWMSFDFGPTLLQWLEGHAPDTYAAVLAADRASRERVGHGNALAMPYHHPILPLSSPRDRVTEIRWGIADFRRRFGREPEGMWLPETAVDAATLDALAAEGIRFTVLAPHQVRPVPEDGRPVRYRTLAGRELALFVYDGEISHAVAFGALLRDGVAWGERMAEQASSMGLCSIATDGETFGHHHEFAEMALARAIVQLRGREGVRLENFAAFLAREGASAAAELVEPSSWSCAHGVERWRADCGCRAHPEEETSQAWRGPLRSALGWLADAIHRIFERHGAPLFGDSWAARDAYGSVAGSVDDEERERFVRAWVGGGGRVTSGPEVRRGLELLEMERHALGFFTSCAWFFDDLDRLEPRQVLAYAARALELAGEDGAALRRGFVSRLERARSNHPEVGTAADLFEGLRTVGA